MLYTIGYRENYERFFIEQKEPMKLGRGPDPRDASKHYPGGSVYLSIEEAKAAAPDGYAVYGLQTDLGNTYWFDAELCLAETCPLVRLADA